MLVYRRQSDPPCAPLCELVKYQRRCTEKSSSSGLMSMIWGKACSRDAQPTTVPFCVDEERLVMHSNTTLLYDAKVWSKCITGHHCVVAAAE